MFKHVVFFVLILLSWKVEAGRFRTGILHFNPSFRISSSSVASRDSGNVWKRTSIGGNIGLQFGNPTNIILSPAIGYTPSAKFFQNRLMVGVGVTYMYYRLKYQGYTYESNIYGGRVFGRFMVTNAFFAYLEYELLNSPPYQVYYYAVAERVWVNSFFVGGGYLLRFSNRGGIMLSLLYNVAWTPVNPVYSSPWNLRVGFML